MSTTFPHAGREVGPPWGNPRRLPPAGRRPWVIAVHGGAGAPCEGSESHGDDPYLHLAEEALEAGVAVLRAGGSGVDAAEAAVRVLEDSPLVNAGRGSALTADGTHEMEACIVDGSSRTVGAVLGLRTTRHPVQGARAVMDRSPHVVLYGCDAWLDEQGIEQRETSWFDTPHGRAGSGEAREKETAPREAKKEGKKAEVEVREKETASHDQKAKQGGKKLEAAAAAHGKEHAGAEDSAGRAASGWAGGSAGAVVLDSNGHLVAASSSGGRDTKWSGALGGTGCPGAGTFACPACAVSCCDIGEDLLRHAAASTVCEMVALGFPLARACESVGREQMGGGGMIAVDHYGDVVTSFTTGAVVYGVAREGEAATVARVAVSGGSSPPAQSPAPAEHHSASGTAHRESTASRATSSRRDSSPWPPCRLA